jgi:biotin carboxylase
VTGADAHPSLATAFCAENAVSPRSGGKIRVAFVGPKAETIRLMGDKVSAKDAP